MSLFAIDYLVQPGLVGLYVLAKNVLYDNYLPENPHVLIDVATNIFAKLVSSAAVIEFIVPTLELPMATWLEPLLHGLINGGIKSQFIDTSNITPISMIRSTFTKGRQPRRVIPKLEHYTMENGFLEGASYNLAAKVSTLPIEALLA